MNALLFRSGALAGQREKLQELRAELADYRDRRDGHRTYLEDLEREPVDLFNDLMEKILKILEYETIERVWIKRKVWAGATDWGKERYSRHVVRTSTDGTGYEDNLEYLSELGREIVGLVVGLAGYSYTRCTRRSRSCC
jgi:hypothetical protein